MNIIWLSPDGSDTTGDGTYEHPFKTFEHSVPLMIDGDQLRLLDGTYTPTDTVLVTGISGSIFSENPRGATIQPDKTTKYDACLAIVGCPRFSVTGINILQAIDKSDNRVGLYTQYSSDFLAYTCTVEDFDIYSGNGYGIYADGNGRVEQCTVSNFMFGGTSLYGYGICSKGMDVIDCTVTALSGTGLTTVVGIYTDGMPTLGPGPGPGPGPHPGPGPGPGPVPPPPPPPPPPPGPVNLMIGGGSLYSWDGVTFATVVSVPNEIHYSVYMLSNTSGFSVGYNTLTTDPVFTELTGAGWNNLALPAGHSAWEWYSVFALNASSVWACGVLDLYYYNGAWSANLAPVAGTFYSIWSNDAVNGTICVGVEGLFAKSYIGGTIGFLEHQSVINETFTSVWATALNNYYVGGYGTPPPP